MRSFAMLAPIENLGTYPSSSLLGIYERGLIERSEPFALKAFRALSAARRQAAGPGVGLMGGKYMPN
jgi:hypothetical protein